MTMLKLISAQDHQPPAEGDTRTVALPNDADAMALPLGGVERVDLHFPNFTDGRAFSQAFLLRRRRGFKGEIRATGDVLIDQLVLSFSPAAKGAPTVCMHGTNSPSTPSTSYTALPMRVISFWLTAT